MTRVSSLSIAPGEASDLVRMNTVLASLSTVSNIIGYDNLADEGVDIRNISVSNLVECGPATHYIESTAANVTGAPAGDFNNEPNTPLGMGITMELDWTLATLTMDASKVVVIVAELAIGYPSLTAGVPDSTNNWGTPGGTMAGVSIAIMTKRNAAAYVVEANSRQSIGGKVKVSGVATGIFGQRQTLTAIHVIEGGTDVIKGIAMAFGSIGTTNYRLYSAQLRAIVFHRATY